MVRFTNSKYKQLKSDIGPLLEEAGAFFAASVSLSQHPLFDRASQTNCLAAMFTVASVQLARIMTARIQSTFPADFFNPERTFRSILDTCHIPSRQIPSTCSTVVLH